MYSILNFYYSAPIKDFLRQSTNEIFGIISRANEFDSSLNQNKAWEAEIEILKTSLQGIEGTIFLEFSIPRMGKRIDCLLLVNNIVFVLEFKVGQTEFINYDIEQVWDYALDLKNFHKPSHHASIIPILVATDANSNFIGISTTTHNDNLALPIKTNSIDLRTAILHGLEFFNNKSSIDHTEYTQGSYSPTPTIIEAAIALYNNHTVENITRSDAEAKNLTITTNTISELIEKAKSQNEKIICFVTGVPGAGKTLVGLKVATSHLDKEKGNTSVYLSGNGPLVAILHEALTRDKVLRDKKIGKKITKKEAKKGVKAFIQIIHHYRDAYLADEKAPYDHVAIFDEAQRAWHKEQTASFMKRKKGKSNFDFSEPEFLISCLDRHNDWAVIVCLVGGGQEINTGEGGISEWIDAIRNKFSHWETYISPNLTDSEYNAIDSLNMLSKQKDVNYNESLHLAVSMRSFRAENLSLFIKSLLDINKTQAKEVFKIFSDKYPIVLTRDLNRAKAWLKEKARGSERYGMIVSSQAQRLKPLAIDVRTPIDPVNWFLNNKDDVRSSYFLEDVATEFQVQGLELDWACVTWDGDLRFNSNKWDTFSFKGNKWERIVKEERRRYLINAYRVLLTRARQGLVIVVPEGNKEDHTRQPQFYDNTFNYLIELGLPVI